MAERTVQLVLHYDGSGFSGWQRQPDQRTVQGVFEQALERLCGQPTAAVGSGRTDAGVHARGQAVGVRVPWKWTPNELRRASNALLPDDVWVAAAHEMRAEFHARYSATARRYSYYVGTDDAAHSPFRRRTEFAFDFPLDRAALSAAAKPLIGQHSFRAFAVKGSWIKPGMAAAISHRTTVNGLPWVRLPADGVICLRSSPAQRRRRMFIHEPPHDWHKAPEVETIGGISGRTHLY